jgi:hypothetical protein
MLRPLLVIIPFMDFGLCDAWKVVLLSISVKSVMRVDNSQLGTHWTLDVSAADGMISENHSLYRWFSPAGLPRETAESHQTRSDDTRAGKVLRK